MQQVAITGMGVVSPIGSGAAAFWDALCAGRHGFRPIADERARSGSRLWAAVPDEYLDDPLLTPQAVRNADRFTQYAVLAAAQALAMASLPAPPTHTAVILGNTLGGLPLLTQTQTQFLEHPQRVTPKLMALVIPNMAAARISLNWALRSRQLTISTACASSLDAVGLAAQMIERGETHYAIAGGTETLLTPVVYESLVHAGALSKTADPARASRPFDVERDGFVMGDGAAVLFLESRHSAKARGARVLGRICGYGSMTDAHHLTAPDPSGQYEASVMHAALEDAGRDVGAIFAHATGTLVGDMAELRAINALFTDSMPVVTALRGHLGHAMAAAGAMSMIAGVLGMHHGLVPQTLGTRHVEPEARFDVVLGAPRKQQYDAFLVNAFGFGGQNACVAVAR